MKPEEMDALVAALDGKEGDLLLFAADKDTIVFNVLGSLRLEMAKRQGLLKKDEYAFLWVTEFPQFEYSEEEGRFVAMHHPFTMPMEEDLDKLETLASVIKDTALCGLGQTSPNPVLSTLSNFREEYEEHVSSHVCRAHKCKALLTYSIDPAKCKGCSACARGCPAEAIVGEVRKPFVINPSLCIRCGMCLSRCKFGAINVI
jgi:NAD-dependent dihydropyrimidine dehydrogenase PreA subunit